MTEKEAIEKIHSVYPTGCKNGLENMRALMGRLGNPQEKLTMVHVAGTNGKGSCCAMIERMLRAAGYKTGLYTSPYIEVYNERIRINGEPIAGDKLAALVESVWPAVEACEKDGVQITEFELGTALAFCCFAKEKVNVAVIEVGLGGRLDPTNIITPAVSVITDPVTTTDELIPSGETSSYRSNPLKLAEFALSRKDPAYVGRAKQVKADEETRRETGSLPEKVLKDVALLDIAKDTVYGSCVVAVKPGDGSAREQAASCQRVLGGIANIAKEYATKRYRSNLINWGMLPFTAEKLHFKVGDYIYIENIDTYISEGAEKIPAKHLSGKTVKDITLSVGSLTQDEKNIILKGCLINFNAAN